MAEFLDGFPRYPKMHPCGVVLSRQPMHELTPTFISNKGYPTTHFDMDAVEAIGLVKMDILAQGGLAVMRDVKASRSARSAASNGGPLDPRLGTVGRPAGLGDDCQRRRAGRASHRNPGDDRPVPQCNVRDIDGLVAIVSVIRPGAANEEEAARSPGVIRGWNRSRIRIRRWNRVCASTFGLVVYEEHILQICEAFAGLPPGARTCCAGR